MSDETLSQNEIDSLLDDGDEEGNDGGSEPTLTDFEKDALGEVANISMGSATTALYGLLDKKVEITAPKVKVSTLQNLIDSYTKPCVVVDVQYIEGLEGSNQLILEVEDAAVITDLMMGGDGTNPPEELDEMHMSAVGEAMNQMMGSASTSMSDFFEGNKIDISPPKAELLEVNTETIHLEDIAPEDEVVKVIFDIHIGDLVHSKLVQVMTIDFAKQMAQGLAPDEEPEASSGQKETEVSSQEQAGGQTEQTQAQQQAQQQAAQRQTAAASQGRPQQPQQPRPAAQQAGPQQLQPDVEVQDVEFDELGGTQGAGPQNDLSLIYDVDLELTVRLGKTRMSIKEILELGPGSVIELNRLAGEAVDLLVNGKLIAKGEVVVIDENFGFRVTDIVSSQQRLKKLE